MESKKSRFITSNHISKYLAKLEPSGAAERRIYAQSTNYYKAVKDIIEIQKRYEYEREKIKSKLHSKLILPSITPEPRLNYKTHSAKKLDKSFDIYGISPTHSPLYRPIMESQTPKVVTLKDRSLSPNIDLDNKKLLLPISMRLKRKEVLRPSQFKGLIVNIPDLLNMDTDSPSPSLNKFEELIFDCDNLVHQNENMVKMIPKARNDFKKPLERLNSLVDAIDICNVDASAER